MHAPPSSCSFFVKRNETSLLSTKHPGSEAAPPCAAPPPPPASSLSLFEQQLYGSGRRIESSFRRLHFIYDDAMLRLAA